MEEVLVEQFQCSKFKATKLANNLDKQGKEYEIEIMGRNTTMKPTDTTMELTL